MGSSRKTLGFRALSEERKSPTIECNVGDNVIVHFRNKDFRSGKEMYNLRYLNRSPNYDL